MFSNNPLSIACQNNDIVKVRHLVEILSLDEVNEEDVNGCTPLHIAALNGNTQILQILLSNKYIDQTIKNREGCLAQDCAPKQLKFLFNEMSTIDEDNDSNEELIEWFDTYNNAHRIAYENHKHLKQWLTKVSFRRLVEEISIGYVDQIDFGSNKVDQKMLIKSYLNESIENNDPIPILRAYTEKTPFVTKLNQDLARMDRIFVFN